MAERGEVIFLGGTAFSGTDVVARLLGAHPGVVAVSIPAALHSDARGIPALLAGRIGLEDFTAGLRRTWRAAIPRGEGDAVPGPEGRRPEAEIERFRDAYNADPLAACRELFWALAGEEADGHRPAALLEASPGNLREAHTLARLVPYARFVHVVRDGRDVAAAVCASTAAPDRVAPALGWWADELREIERGVRGEEDGTRYAIRDDRFALVIVGDLASGDRAAEYARLAERLGLSLDPRMGSIVERELDPGAIAHERRRGRAGGVGAWRLARRYRRLLAELEQESNHAAPALIRAYERSG